MSYSSPLFSGDLKTDSPALQSELLRISSPATLPRFEHSYRLSFEHRGCDDSEIHREPGVRFNPAPARLCSILMKDCNERDADLLEAALLYPAALDGVQDALPAGSRAPYELARAAKSWSQEKPLPAPLERLWSAAHLDRLRHLHMGTLTLAELTRHYKFTKEIVLPLLQSGDNNRLRELISAWVERFERQHDLI